MLENQGCIEGNYSLLPSSSLFGPKFTFNPSSGQLLPDALQAIQISFSSSTLGKFDEEFTWEVDKAPLPLKLRIKWVNVLPKLGEIWIIWQPLNFLGEEWLVQHFNSMCLRSNLALFPTVKILGKIILLFPAFLFYTPHSPPPLPPPILHLCFLLLFLLLLLLLLFNFIPHSGFPRSSEVVLTNTSEVPMTFRLWVPGERKEQEVEGQRQHHKHEFTIHPHSGTLPPNIHRNIKVLFPILQKISRATCKSV